MVGLGARRLMVSGAVSLPERVGACRTERLTFVWIIPFDVRKGGSVLKVLVPTVRQLRQSPIASLVQEVARASAFLHCLLK